MYVKMLPAYVWNMYMLLSLLVCRSFWNWFSQTRFTSHCTYIPIHQQKDSGCEDVMGGGGYSWKSSFKSHGMLSTIRYPGHTVLPWTITMILIKGHLIKGCSVHFVENTGTRYTAQVLISSILFTGKNSTFYCGWKLKCIYLLLYVLYMCVCMWLVSKLVHSLLV